ncbi:hypothetical protein Tco_1055443 [Tanacetum coccineum]|uniref:Uncharacterized protein n=1 Tax=Tanacetum coccineum TaxID=301880 RepID=A0ABQ5H0V2_9ASTR
MVLMMSKVELSEDDNGILFENVIMYFEVRIDDIDFDNIVMLLDLDEDRINQENFSIRKIMNDVVKEMLYEFVREYANHGMKVTDTDSSCFPLGGPFASAVSCIVLAKHLATLSATSLPRWHPGVNRPAYLQIDSLKMIVGGEESSGLRDDITLEKEISGIRHRWRYNELRNVSWLRLGNLVKNVSLEKKLFSVSEIGWNDSRMIGYEDMTVTT